MTIDKGIIIKNIFYMLAYAYQVLQQTNYQEIEAEDFDNINNLFAAILSVGMNQQVKQGLSKAYIQETDDLTTLRGRLDINGSIQNKINSIQKISCTYDTLSEDYLFNQILKSTAMALVNADDVKRENRIKLRKSLAGFSNVSRISLKTIPWSTISFQRNNQNYRMLLFVCYFVIKQMLLSTEDGSQRLRSFTDEHMAALYEKFILEYYSRNHPELHASAAEVSWDIRGEISERDLSFLPKMKTDITLSKGDRKLIIDAKYYREIWQKFDIDDPDTSTTIRNAHLNQIMNYVRNTDIQNSGNTAGMLLYAQTGTQMFRWGPVNIGGNYYSVRTFDLNKDFQDLSAQLDDIVNSYFD